MSLLNCKFTNIIVIQASSVNSKHLTYNDIITFKTIPRMTYPQDVGLGKDSQTVKDKYPQVRIVSG